MSQNTPSILIADEMHPSLFPMLTEAGFRYAYQPKITRPELMDQLGAFDGLIIRSKTNVNDELLSHAPHLRFIGRAGAGLDLLDMTAIERRGIRVFHAGAGNRDAVAEHSVGMLLVLLTNLLKADREVRQGIWDREGNRGYELGSLTVGLIGYGNNGQATARRLSGFGCRVLAYDKYRDHYTDAFARESSLQEIMAEADVVSLHIPLTADTRHLIDDAFVGRCPGHFTSSILPGVKSSVCRQW